MSRWILMIMLVSMPIGKSFAVIKDTSEITDNVRHNLVLSLINGSLMPSSDGAEMSFSNCFTSAQPTSITFELGAKILGGFVVVARRTSSKEIFQKLCDYIKRDLQDCQYITGDHVLAVLSYYHYQITLHQLTLFLEEDDAFMLEALPAGSVSQSIFSWAYSLVEPYLHVAQDTQKADFHECKSRLIEVIIKHDFNSLRKELNKHCYKRYNNYQIKTFDEMVWAMARNCIQEIYYK